jgi:hypothetical protein
MGNAPEPLKADSVDPEASKVRLLLRCPFQRPKRAIGIFGQLHSNLPKAPSSKHETFGNPFLK